MSRLWASEFPVIVDFVSLAVFVRDFEGWRFVAFERVSSENAEGVFPIVGIDRPLAARAFGDDGANRTDGRDKVDGFEFRLRAPCARPSRVLWDFQ